MNTNYTGRWPGYVVAVLSVSALTLFLKIVGAHVNAATVSLALLLNVLFIATRWGSWPALLASIVAMLCFNFFFLPPFGTFTIADPHNWVGEMFSSSTAGTFKNAAHYKNPKVDALLEKALSLTDQAERAKLYEEATRIIVDEAPGLWIYNTKWYGPYSNKLKGIVFCPIGSAQEMRTAYYEG